MTKTRPTQPTCAICGKTGSRREIVSGEAIRPQLATFIRQTHPDWVATGDICRSDLDAFRAAYVQSIIESEKGELTGLEQEVLRSINQHELISDNIDAEYGETWSAGERLADRIASFGGSWAFLITFGIFISLWILVNSLVLLWRPADPYPFILLNLMLSCLAAIQAPIIMMSQNRSEAKDRLRSENDYQVNLKAELEIGHINEKLDHLLSHQWTRLVEIQEIQLDLLKELDARK